MEQNQQKLFEEFKQLINHSDLFISEYFSLLRNKVDIAANIYMLENNETSTETWIQMIDRLNSEEQKLVANLNSLEVSKQISNYKFLLEITPETDGLFSVEYLSMCIWEFKKFCLMNCFIIFVDKFQISESSNATPLESLQEHMSKRLKYDHDTCESLQSMDSFGKLIFIADDFIKEKNLQIFQSGISSKSYLNISTETLICIQYMLMIERTSLSIETFSKYNIYRILLNSRLDLDTTMLQYNMLNCYNNLRVLDLSHNHLEYSGSEDFSGLVKLKELWLNYNNISCLGDNVFDKLVSLETLHLEDNKIDELDPNIFSFLLNIKVIMLNNNRIENLNANLFNGLTLLRVLSFDNNRITEIDSDLFKDNCLLQGVNFSNNLLQLVQKIYFL